MIFEQIIEKKSIDKGWSGDKKYRVMTKDGGVYLLRISPPERLERVKAQFVRMQTVAALGIPMCLPLEVGICEEGAYSIQTWIDGEDAESVLPTLPLKKQYAYGLDAGRILKKIHSLPAPAGLDPWFVKFHRKLDRNLANYAACPLKYDHDAPFLRYIETTQHLLKDRPQCFQHGDYHVGNMMIDRSGMLTIIDFDRDDYGDPWAEFNRITWCARLSPAFSSGLMDGYFNGEVPLEFWQLLALYLCGNILGSLPWAIPFGEAEIKTMRHNAVLLLDWYDNFRTVIPGWYQK